MAASISFQDTETSGTTASSYTLSLTVASASGQERLVALSFVTSGNPASRTISSVTVDGQSATAVDGAEANDVESGGGGNGIKTVFYRAPGTAGTSIDVAVVLNGNCFSAFCAVWTLTDAGTLLDVATSTVDDPSLSLDTATGGVAAAASQAYSNSLVAPTATWSGLTEVFDAVRVFGDEDFTGASLNVGSGSTPLAVGITYSAFGGENDAFASVAVSFNEDAGGGGGTILPQIMAHYYQG